MLDYQRRIIEDRLRPFRVGGYDRKDHASRSHLRVAGSLVSLSGFAACLTILYQGMRGIMRLGGFVASGGPYEIAHPAPGWVWVVPVSIVAGLLFVGLGFLFGRSAGGLSLLILAWPALFLSLGWNFLDFALKPRSMGQGIVWAWLVCGVIFVVMGGIPALFFFKAFARRLSGRGAGQGGSQDNEDDPGRRGSANVSVLLIQVLFLALGIYAGIQLFRAVTGS